MSLLRPVTLLGIVSVASCGGEPPPATKAPPVSSVVAEAPPVASSSAAPLPAASSTPSPPPSAAPAAEPAAPRLPPPTFVEDVAAAPPARMPSVTVSSPRKDEVVPVDKAPDLDVRFALSAFKLGGGNRLELVLDDRAALFVDDASRRVHLRDVDPSPAANAPGQHLLVALLLGPTGEAVKPVGKGRPPVAVVSFFVGQRSAPAWKEGAPLLVYAGPPPGMPPPEGLLVDFYLVNAELGNNKYSVHASVTGPDLMTGKVIESWKPWRVRGARQGSYTVRLELARYQHELGESGSSTTVVLVSKAVDGRWTTVTRDFDVLPP